MKGDTADDVEEPLASLVAVVEDPAAARRRLPHLVGLLDHEDETIRTGAGWAACHLAAEQPDVVPYLTRRVADRLTDSDPSLAVELVFAYLDARYPDVVADELDAVASEEAARPSVTSIEGSLARANYHLPEIGNRDVGRTRLAGEGSSPGPQRVYADDEDHRHDQEATDDDERGRAGDDSTADERTGEDTDDSGTGGPADSDADRDARWEPADELSAILSRSRFARLTVLARRDRDRYADVYRTLGVLDGEELPVALALYHRPADHHEAFAAALDDQLARWHDVSDHDNVLTLYDWGAEPSPWSAATYTETRLADRDDVSFDEALRDARSLADAVEHVHENGVVHAGIDPGNVVYYGNVIDEDDRQPPLLANVGVMHVVREFFDPSARLDPRYAAPEYYDRKYGRIDHATDVYQLGAVLYRLFTGKPPYDGTYETVREAVLEHPPPRPSAVVDVPDAVDDVVTKAMARQKLRRYETVTHMERELRAIDEE